MILHCHVDPSSPRIARLTVPHLHNPTVICAGMQSQGNSLISLKARIRRYCVPSLCQLYWSKFKINFEQYVGNYFDILDLRWEYTISCPMQQFSYMYIRIRIRECYNYWERWSLILAFFVQVRYLNFCVLAPPWRHIFQFHLLSQLPQSRSPNATRIYSPKTSICLLGDCGPFKWSIVKWWSCLWISLLSSFTSKAKNYSSRI